ncbi:MAG: hypothetical protein ACI9UN_003750, partial [Granulosicoccus sp.]
SRGSKNTLFLKYPPDQHFSFSSTQRLKLNNQGYELN